MLLTQKSGQSIAQLRKEISGCRSLFDGIALACGWCTRRFWGSLRDQKHVDRRQETTRKHIILNASRLHTKTKHAEEWFQGCLLTIRAILHPDEVLLWLAKRLSLRGPSRERHSWEKACCRKLMFSLYARVQSPINTALRLYKGSNTWWRTRCFSDTFFGTF